MNPRIVYLNGCSSAGKTTLAKALQNDMPSPYLHVCIDAFEDMMPRVYEDRPFTYDDVLGPLIAGMHASIHALASAGNNLIVDHILIADCEPHHWVPGGLSCVEDYDVLFVAVRCPLNILENREKVRGDRRIGLAAWQFERVYKGIFYDLEVDTSVLGIEECVRRVKEAAQAKFGVL